MTGGWSLLLQSLGKIISLFAATGHIHYAKSGRLFLQEMLRLKTDYPWVYKRFTDNVLHIIRRSDRFWAGLWTDLITEQVMMKSLMSRGGLNSWSRWFNSWSRCNRVRAYNLDRQHASLRCNPQFDEYTHQRYTQN